MIAGGAGEGPLLRDAWFAGAFLCGFQQRRSVVLGLQLLRTSDAFHMFSFDGADDWLVREGACRADCFCFHSRRLATAPRRGETRPFPFCLRSLTCGLIFIASVSLFQCLALLFQIEFRACHLCPSLSVFSLLFVYCLEAFCPSRIPPIFLRPLLFPR